MMTSEVRMPEDVVRDNKKQEEMHFKYKERDVVRARYLSIIVLMTIASSFLMTYWSFAKVNPEIFKLNQDSLQILGDAYNAVAVLLIPFLFGAVAAVARILISEVSIDKALPIIIASGLMGMFSWVGVKSGILISLLTPYIHNPSVTANLANGGFGNFYSMALVSILVGMFSSNLYVFVSQKLEKLAKNNN